MPLIVLSYMPEALEPERAMAALEDMRRSLARNYSMKGFEAAIGSFARCRLDPVSGGSRSTGGTRDAGGCGRYEVDVSVPQGGLDDEGAAAFMREVAEILVAAEGAEQTEANHERVCCVVREMTDGRWSIGTRTMTRMRIVKEAVRRQRALGANARAEAAREEVAAIAAE